VQAEGLLAVLAFEVDVVVVVHVLIAGLGAGGVFDHRAIVDDPMDQALVLKGFERSIEGYTVEAAAERLFDFAVGQGVGLAEEQSQRLFSRKGFPHGMALEDLLRALEVLAVSHLWYQKENIDRIRWKMEVLAFSFRICLSTLWSILPGELLCTI
jgi:hypothetical protein